MWQKGPWLDAEEAQVRWPGAEEVPVRAGAGAPCRPLTVSLAKFVHNYLTFVHAEVHRKQPVGIQLG